MGVNSNLIPAAAPLLLLLLLLQLTWGHNGVLVDDKGGAFTVELGRRFEHSAVDRLANAAKHLCSMDSKITDHIM
jgi:hypothetical protein